MMLFRKLILQSKILLKRIYYFFFYKKIFANFPDWKKILHKSYFIRLDNYKKNILIASSFGSNKPTLNGEIIFASALKLRDANVHFLACNEALTTCSEVTFKSFTHLEDLFLGGIKKHCVHCWKSSEIHLNSEIFIVHKYKDYLDKSDFINARKIVDEIEDCKLKDFTFKKVKIGEHAYAGALRFFARGDLNDLNSYKVLRYYLYSAILTYLVTKRVLLKNKISTLVLNHGIYVPQGIIAETASSLGVNVVTWLPTYKKGCFIFTHKETYHKHLLNEKTTLWKNLKLKNQDIFEVKKYINSRRQGYDDWISFQRKNQSFNFKEFAKEKSINLKKPIISLFTNVIWDAQLFYDQNIFKNMIEWIFETIDFAITNNLQLIIRVHPAELTGSLPSRQNVIDEINKKYKKLPKNIIIVAPNDKLSSYTLIDNSSFCIVYASTIASEIAAMGKSVIAGGETWIKNKSISLDPKNKKQYFKFINQLAKKPKLSTSRRYRALKYAYHFFFRRMIPIKCINILPGEFSSFNVDHNLISQIKPGKNCDKGIDVICNGILFGSEFIYPAEKY